MAPNIQLGEWSKKPQLHDRVPTVWWVVPIEGHNSGRLPFKKVTSGHPLDMATVVVDGFVSNGHGGNLATVLATR